MRCGRYDWLLLILSNQHDDVTNCQATHSRLLALSLFFSDLFLFVCLFVCLFVFCERRLLWYTKIKVDIARYSVGTYRKINVYKNKICQNIYIYILKTASDVLVKRVPGYFQNTRCI